MKRVPKDIHVKSIKIFLVLFSSLMLGACTQSTSNVDEADDTNDTVIVDTGVSEDPYNPVIADTNDTVESNVTVTYFDISFPVDGVDYSMVSVNDVNLSEGARQLSAQCAQCHGSYGVAVSDWPDLWGNGRSIARWMQDYQDPDNYIDNVMYLHAIAYTNEEVQLIKEYYENITYTGGL